MEYSENGYHAMDPDVMEEIRKYRIAYIYGAGLTGQRVCKKLEHNGVLIGGFLTKDSEESAPILMGRSVQSLDDADIPDDAVVVVAVKMMFWEETRTLLAERNIPYVFHRKL